MESGAIRSAASRSTPGGARYITGEVLASGAMGVVHRAFDTFRGQEVAFKRLRRDVQAAHPHMGSVFRREYDVLTRLKHPNIVETFDFGEDAEGPFYTMELLDGLDLVDAGAISVSEMCGILRDVASALGLVHARGLVHRDVAPRNIRLTRLGTAKLIDFGALTPFGRATDLIGTPPFIAPECLHGGALDQRTDLYALGALAYWVLTRRPHLNARSVDGLLAAQDTPVIPPSRLVAGLSPGIDELILSMLQTNPALRPDTAAYVIEHLTTLGALEPERHEREVAFSYLKHPPLIGRDSVVSQLNHALTGIQQGHGAAFFIEAAPGLGRTALLDQLGTDAQLAGAAVLRFQGSSQLSFGCMRELLEQGRRISTVGNGEQSGGPGRAHVSGISPATAVEAFERRLRVAEELRASLLALSAAGPLVVLVDDAHLCDSESIDLLTSLQDAIGEHPVLIVLSMLSIAAFSEDARPAKRARTNVITLGPLSEDQYVALLTTIFRGVPNAQRLARWLHAQSGGNPARGMDQVRLLLQSGALRYERGTFVLPHDLDSSVVEVSQGSFSLAQLSELRASERRVSELLSLHEGSLSLEDLAEVSELPTHDLVVALDQLVQRGLITTDGERATISGESLRVELATSMTDDRRNALHAALARWSQSRQDSSLDSDLTIAKHLLAAGPEFELAGADLISTLRRERFAELTMSARAVPLVERALAVYRHRGYSDRECSSLRAVLIGAGFYGHPQAARQHLAPTMEHLSVLCGFTLARRLAPYLGHKAALVIGLFVGAARGVRLPPRLADRSLRLRMATFFAIASASMASAASAYDYETQARLLGWLDVASHFPKGTVPALAWEFNAATSELSRGRTIEAAKRLAALLRQLSEPVPGLEEHVRVQLRLGCIHCLGHAAVDCSSPEALRWADELEAGSPFYAPHAEVVRMVYRMVRGERVLAERHRTRAEQLAFLGGLSWTAASLLAMRTLEFSVATNDTIELVRVIAELDRLTVIAPGLAFYRELGRARLEHMRGKPETCIAMALELSDQARAGDIVTRMLTIVYSDALNALGSFASAKELCETAISESEESARVLVTSLRLPWIQLARAEAGLGHVSKAETIVDHRLGEAIARDNPLELGLLHAARAEVAISARDGARFDTHFHAAGRYFHLISCPSLLQQLDSLLGRAVSAGIREELPVPDTSDQAEPYDSLDGSTFIER